MQHQQRFWHILMCCHLQVSMEDGDSIDVVIHQVGGSED